MKCDAKYDCEFEKKQSKPENSDKGFEEKWKNVCCDRILIGYVFKFE